MRNLTKEEQESINNYINSISIKTGVNFYMEDTIIYFELNDWFGGRDYPDVEPFVSWMNDDNINTYFRNEDWVKDNKLVVCFSNYDMSWNVCVTATKEWVEEICPELLTKYTQFIKHSDEDGDIIGQFGCPFLPYTEDNIGIHYYDEQRNWFYDDDGDPDYYETYYVESDK